MLENLLSLEEISKNPILMFVWALIIGIVGIMIALQVSFDLPGTAGSFNLTGLFAVLFVIIPSIPFIIMLIKEEEISEEKAIENHYMQNFWEKHGKDVMILLFYFAGVTVAFSIMSFILPDGTFQIQLATINEIRGFTGSITGHVNAAAINSYGSFIAILLNNLQVLMFAFLFSFAFGAGAIFIIVWNAAILGVFIGNLSKSIFEIPLVSLLFIPHGIPEIGGYLIAGLAGGILSAALIRKIPTRTLELIIFDAFKMLTFAVALIFIGAGIEAFL